MIIDPAKIIQNQNYFSDAKEYWDSVLYSYSEPYDPAEIADQMGIKEIDVLNGIRLHKYGWDNEKEELVSKSEFAFDNLNHKSGLNQVKPDFKNMSIDELKNCIKNYQE